MVTMAGLPAAITDKPQAVPSFVAKNLYLSNLPNVDAEIPRTITTYATVIAIAYCHATRRSFMPPNSDADFVENFLIMIGQVDQNTGHPDPLHVHALETMWLLSADHELTKSTAALLHAASSFTDPISCFISALSSGYGLLHGDAIEVAYAQIQEVGKVENVPLLIDKVKRKGQRLFGYGHQIYRAVDLRSKIIKGILAGLLEREGREKDLTLDIAWGIDRIAGEDEYFVSRNLKCNADLFASFVYKAM